MKLKRLDIHGFKSFYHRTTVVFDEGVTAVVGPNGCGKSNVVDALKWVMGEQGAKALRGAAMEDVVFAGSEKRGPMGMCEVCLTFVNDGSAEVPARWHGVAEIAIERRLERDKGSDYLVNKKRCRLADVQDLLAGTGVGSGPGGGRAYAIVEQGQIGRIVSARANERRLLIEEAAGITRYRNRRRAAERKMDETRLNLERVEDVVREVESRLRSLRRQARKAERFKEYRAEARHIGLKAAVFEHHAMVGERARAGAELAELERRAADAGTSLETEEAKRAAAAVEERVADEAARAAADALSSAERTAEQARSRLELLEAEARTLSRQLDEAREDIQRAAGRVAELVAELAEARGAVKALEAEGEGDGGRLEALEGERKKAQLALLDARAEAERLRREEAEESHALARARAEQEGAERRAREFMERAGGLDGERARLLEEQAELRAHAEQAAAELAAAEAEITAAQGSREESIAAREAQERAADAARKQERAATEALAHARSRLTSLEELERKREGLGEGSRAVLDGGLEGVLGAVPERLDVPAELEAAVASILGERLAGVLVEDLGAATGAVGFLRQRGRGRGVFVAVGAPAPEVSAPPTLPGVRGLLAELAEAPPLTRALLGDALLVDDLEVALRIAAEGLWGGALVTPDGTRLEGRAFLAGGAEAADPAPLSRRREIRDLTAEVERLQAAREAAEAAVRAATDAAAEARRATEEAARAVHRAELRRAEARKDQSRAEGQAHALDGRAERLATEAERLRAESHSAAEVALVAKGTLERAMASRVDRHRAIEAADLAATEAEDARDLALSRVHEAPTEAVARKERLDAARGGQQRLERQIAELEERSARASRSRGETERRLGEIAEQRVACERTAADAGAEASERAGVLGAARERWQAAQSALQVAERAREASRGEREGLREAVTEARLALQERTLKLDHLATRVQETYGEAVGEAAARFADEGPPGPDELGRLQELQALIDALGDVNLGAIEEHEEVSERYEFLQTQREDLVAALADLEQAIERIDETSRHLFAETFEAVNAQFAELFPRLFRGGRAELVLTDPDDLLETGIEMLAEPPGKKVQNVELMCGGENALCA